MNYAFIFIFVLLYTQSALQSCGGVSPQPPPVCSIHLDDATAATRQRLFEQPYLNELRKNVFVLPKIMAAGCV